MAICRKQQKNEFDDCHDCELVYRCGLSENHFTQCFPTNILQKKGERSIYIVFNTNGMY